jgi:hypothetical protein
MTRQLFGTLTFMAVMSAVLAKFFSQLAFAGGLPSQIRPSDLAGSNGQFLGQYVVTEERSKGKADGADLCPNRETYGAAVSCGNHVWAYANDEELILISMPDKDAIKKDEIMVWTYEGKQCAGYSSLSAALSKGIFNLGLCSLSVSSSDPMQAVADKPTTGGEVVADVLSFGLLGLGSHSSQVSFLGTDSNVMEVEDKYPFQGIDNKMHLEKRSGTVINRPVQD